MQTFYPTLTTYFDSKPVLFGLPSKCRLLTGTSAVPIRAILSLNRDMSIHNHESIRYQSTKFNKYTVNQDIKHFYFWSGFCFTFGSFGLISSCVLLFVCLSISFLPMALLFYFRSISLTVPLVSFASPSLPFIYSFEILYFFGIEHH